MDVWMIGAAVAWMVAGYIAAVDRVSKAILRAMRRGPCNRVHELTDDLFQSLLPGPVGRFIDRRALAALARDKGEA